MKKFGNLGEKLRERQEHGEMISGMSMALMQMTKDRNLAHSLIGQFDEKITLAELRTAVDDEFVARMLDAIRYHASEDGIFMVRHLGADLLMMLESINDENIVMVDDSAFKVGFKVRSIRTVHIAKSGRYAGAFQIYVR